MADSDYGDFAVLRGEPSDGLRGLAGFGPKKAADLVRKYGSVPAMIEAGVFRASDAEYLEKAMRVVAPVRDLKIKVPRGRRDRYPEDPARVEELGRRYGVNSPMEGPIKTLSSLPALSFLFPPPPPP